MTVDTEPLRVLGELYRRGFVLTISGDSLRVRAPAGELTDAWRALIVKHKATIIDLLGEGEFPDDTLPGFYIPKDVPNTVEAIKACLDSQRVPKRPAAFSAKA